MRNAAQPHGMESTMRRRTGNGQGRALPMLAAFAGGSLVAFVAGRLLPPVLGQAFGSMRAAQGHDPFEALAQDHRRVLAMLDRLEATGADGAVRRASLFLMVKRALTAHALAEEDVIYPMLRDQANREEESRKLYEDHAELKVLLFELEQMPKDDPQWIEKVRTLRRRIEEHARMEEETEFPKLRETLDHKGMMKLAGSVQREKMMVL